MVWGPKGQKRMCIGGNLCEAHQGTCEYNRGSLGGVHNYRPPKGTPICYIVCNLLPELLRRAPNSWKPAVKLRGLREARGVEGLGLLSGKLTWIRRLLPL